MTSRGAGEEASPARGILNLTFSLVSVMRGAEGQAICGPLATRGTGLASRDRGKDSAVRWLVTVASLVVAASAHGAIIISDPIAGIGIQQDD